MKVNEIRVLVVDDSTTMRKVLISNLLDCGITHCDEAKDGKTAWDMLCTSRYHLVFMDYNMPIINGLELAKKIFLDKALSQKVRAVVISSSLNKELVENFKTLGIRNFLVKPFNLAMFKSVIGPMLTRGIIDDEDKRPQVTFDDISAITSTNKAYVEFDGKFLTLDFGSKTLVLDTDYVIANVRIFDN